MKLYFAPGACSMAAHIALRESGLPFTTEKVEFGVQHKTSGGKPFADVNAKNSVPALELDNGEMLTENAVILQYVADQAPKSGLAPAAGTLPRYRLMETLNFLATEVHKASFAPLFSPATPDDYKPIARANLEKKLDFLEARVPAEGYLFGSGFTVADAYAFTLLNWANFLQIDLGKWPSIKAYIGRVAARPGVARTMKDEGLLH